MGDTRASRQKQAVAADAARPPASIDGESLARAFAGGAEALRRQTDAINAINVFPVPDGDTGTNMYLTMRAAVEAVAAAGKARSARDVAAAAAQGALMGAKGNSGVILSQILSGLAAMPEGEAAFDAAALADGLERARDAAYKVVSAPKEGTILTAISAAAAGAGETAAAGDSADGALEAAVAAAEDAVARTPELLPVLKEAGVVDSGAQGLFVLLEGMLRGLRGEDAAAHAGGFGAIDASWISATQQVHAHDGAQAGFCTEFVISGEALDATSIRDGLRDLGDSLLVVGGGAAVRVHIHTKTPDDALAYAHSAGAVSHEKVDDMEAQFRALAGRVDAGPPAQLEGIAVVAVGAGAGIEDLLRSMGAQVVRGGQTMNPSAGDIRRAIESSGAAEVIVLPNNKNIVLAAKQAAEGLAVRAHVIETRSVPQGIAAMVALNTEAAFDENIAAMEEASANVGHGEVTLAARATTLHGIAIREGQPIGIVDGEIEVAEETVAEAVRACVAKMVAGRDAPLVTLYAGDGEAEASATAIADALRGEFAVEVEVVMGGQPHYPYLIGVE